jgi:Zn-dependent protease
MKPLLRLLLRAGWAPLLVLLFHQWLLQTPYRQQLDFVMHYSGGVAIAFFLWHALYCFAHWFGKLTPFARYLFTFALACTVGLFWEFAELYSDVVYGSHIQHNVRETMRDLIADATGALTTLGLTFAVRCLVKQRSVQ